MRCVAPWPKQRSTGRPKDLAALPALEATLRARDGDVRD
jgi:hypothetical protein